MAVQYNKLFHILVDKKMTNSQLAEKSGISMNIITRLRQDKYVSMESIEKICFALDCKVDDVLEFNRNEG